MGERRKKPKEERRWPEIGERLIKTRLALGYASPGDFLEDTGIAQNTYSQYETGERRPSIEQATKLCESYGLTLDWIYRGEPSGLSVALAKKLIPHHKM